MKYNNLQSPCKSKNLWFLHVKTQLKVLCINALYSLFPDAESVDDYQSAI